MVTKISDITFSCHLLLYCSFNRSILLAGISDYHINTNRFYPSPTVLKDLFRALELNKGVSIDYVGAKLGDTAQRRIIDPVRFVFISGRWHVHAYCRSQDEGRDFVLSRILTSHGICEREHAELAYSIREMDRNVTIRVAPHPDLTVDQRLAVRREYSFVDAASKEIVLKKHQLYYFRKSYLASKNEGPPDKLLIAL